MMHKLKMKMSIWSDDTFFSSANIFESHWIQAIKDKNTVLTVLNAKKNTTLFEIYLNANIVQLMKLCWKHLAGCFAPLHAQRGLGRINWKAGAINLLKNIVIWEVDLTPESAHTRPRDNATIPFRDKRCLGSAPPHRCTCSPSACWDPNTVIPVKDHMWTQPFQAYNKCLCP